MYFLLEFQQIKLSNQCSSGIELKPYSNIQTFDIERNPIVGNGAGTQPAFEVTSAERIIWIIYVQDSQTIKTIAARRTEFFMQTIDK